MNNIAVLPYISLHALQIQNIKRNVAKKANINELNNEIITNSTNLNTNNGNENNTYNVNNENNENKIDTTKIDDLSFNNKLEPNPLPMSDNSIGTLIN